MVKIIMESKDYKEIQKIGNKYSVHVLPTQEGDFISCFEEVIDHEPTVEEIETITSDAMIIKAKYDAADLAIAINEKVSAIEKYDKSSSVNEFTLYGDKIWLDKDIRVGLVNAANSAKLVGQVNVTLGLGSKSYTLPCDTALQMLASLEMYALECYNVTLAHKNAVKELETIEEVKAYDYTVGYPSKLVFD